MMKLSETAYEPRLKPTTSQRVAAARMGLTDSPKDGRSLPGVRELGWDTVETGSGRIMVHIPGVRELGWDTVETGGGRTAAVRYLIGPDIMRGTESLRADLFYIDRYDRRQQLSANTDVQRVFARKDTQGEIEELCMDIDLLRRILHTDKAPLVMRMQPEDLILVMVGHWPGDQSDTLLPEYIREIAIARLGDRRD